MLSTTSISIVPVIYRGIVRSVDQLKELVRGPSAYNDQLREGLVIRMFHSSTGTNAPDANCGSTSSATTAAVITTAATTTTATAATVAATASGGGAAAAAAAAASSSNQEPVEEEGGVGSLENWLVWRAKLVRSDFIAGNERWNRTSKLATNSLSEEKSGYA